MMKTKPNLFFAECTDYYKSKSDPDRSYRSNVQSIGSNGIPYPLFHIYYNSGNKMYGVIYPGGDGKPKWFASPYTAFDFAENIYLDLESDNITVAETSEIKWLERTGSGHLDWEWRTETTYYSRCPWAKYLHR